MRSGSGFVEVVLMVPHRCPILGGGLGGGHAFRSPRSRGGRWSMGVISVICVSLGVLAVACCLSGDRESEGVGVTWTSGEHGAEGGEDVAHEGCMCCSCFPISSMAGDICSAANARIRSIAKTGHPPPPLSAAVRPHKPPPEC